MNHKKYQQARADVASLTRIVVRQAEQLADRDDLVTDLKSRLRKLGAEARGHGENQKVRVNALRAKQAELALALKQRDELQAKLNSELHRRDLADRQHSDADRLLVEVMQERDLLRADNEALNAKVEDLQGRLGNRRRRVDELKAELADRDRAVDELKTELADQKVAEASIASKARVEEMERIEAMAAEVGKMTPSEMEEVLALRDNVRRGGQ